LSKLFDNDLTIMLFYLILSRSIMSPRDH